MTDEPAPFELLDAYQSGGMSDADAQAFEEELFASAASGIATEAAFVDHVTRIGQHLEPRGGFDIGSTRARVDSLIAQGLRVQILVPADLTAKVLQLPRIEDDVDIVVTHLPLDVRGYDSVNVHVEKADGTYLKTFREISWDPDSGNLYAVCEAPLARISAQVGRVRTRIIGTRDGAEHHIATFETVTAP